MKDNGTYGKGRPALPQVTFAYNTAGRVQTVTRPEGVTEQLVPLQFQGYPTTVVMAAEAQAKYTDGESNVWQSRLDWLGFGRATQQTDPLTNQSVLYRDANGLAWLTADPLSPRTRYFYDTKGNPTKVVLPDDNYEQYTYDPTFNLRLSYTDAAFKVTTYTRDTNGNLTVLTQPDPGDNSGTPLTSYTYYTTAPLGRLQSVQDPDQHTTTYTYASTGIKNRVVQITYPTAGNPTVSFGYDSASNLAFRTDERGKTTSMAYDALNRLSLVTLPADTGPNPTYAYGYDAASNLLSVTNPFNKSTTYIYDGLNRLIGAEDALLHTTTYTYYKTGDVKTLKDALSNVSTYSYDVAGHLVGITDPLSHTVTYGYDAAGQQISVTDALSHTTTYTYNVRGMQSGVTDPLGNQVTYAYNATGNQIAVTEYDPGSQVPPVRPSQTFTTTLTYDALRRLTQVKDSVTAIDNFFFDKAGYQTGVSGADHSLFAITKRELWAERNPGPTNFQGDGNFTFTYDERGRLSTNKDAAGNVTTYGHDPAENLSYLACPTVGIPMDVQNRVTTYTYDAQNRVIAVTDAQTPTHGVTTYAYNLAGRLLSVTDPVNNVTSYGYDDANRLITVTDPNNKLTTYQYDAANRLTQKIDRRNLTTSYGYDNANRLITEQWYTGSTLTRTFTYAYDNANRLTSAQDPASSYAYGYDNANQLTSVDNLGTPGVPRMVLTYGYDGLHNRIRLDDSLSGTVTYGYDGDHHLTAASMVVGSNQGPQVTLHYDSLNRIDSLTRFLTAPGNTVTTTFHYDTDHRLDIITHASSTNPLTPLATYTYTYDVGSRITRFAGPGESVTYVYDPVDQLTAVTGTRAESYTYDLNGNRTSANGITYGAPGPGNRLTNDGTFTYAYDNEGNVVTQVSSTQTITYTWDQRNRLTEVQISGSVTAQDDRFTYDVNDRRIGKSTVSGGQMWTVYDGDNLYADFNGGSNPTYRYLYGNAVDALFARYDGTSGNNSTAWYLTDIVGSVRQMAKTDGTLLATITYDSFGKVLSGTGDRFKFTGREYDSETGLQFNRARYYDPRIGRFTGEDPIDFTAGDANLYRYTGNSPTDATDPTGLKVMLYLKEVYRGGVPLGSHVVIIVTGTSEGDYTINGGGGTTSGTPTDPTPHWGRHVPQGHYWDVISPYATADEELEALWEVFLDLEQVPYHAKGPNSNTYARQLLNLAGFEVRPSYEGVRGEPILTLGGEQPTTRWVPVGPTATTGWNDKTYGGPDYDKYGCPRPTKYYTAEEWDAILKGIF